MLCSCREEYQLLQAVQAKLAIHPLTAPVLGNDHKKFRSRESMVCLSETLSEERAMLDRLKKKKV